MGKELDKHQSARYLELSLTPLFILSHSASAPWSNALSKKMAPTRIVNVNVDVLLNSRLYTVVPNAGILGFFDKTL